MNDLREAKNHATKSDSKGKRPSDSIRNPSRWLIFVGALIVFTTFVVKDELRERSKDLMDSVETANSTFTIRYDSYTTLAMLQIVDQRIDRVSARFPLSGRSSQSIASEEVSERLDTFIIRWKGIENVLNSLEYLLATVPHGDNADKKLQELVHRMYRVRESYISCVDTAHQEINQNIIDSVTERYNRFLQKHDTQEDSPHRHSIDLDSHFKTVTKDLDSLFSDVHDFRHKVLGDAEKVAIETKRTYSRWRWASYALYVLGWTLGLVDKLFGIEGMSIG